MNEVIATLRQFAGGDGDDFAPGVGSALAAHEDAELLDAWLIERGRSIECLLILGRVRRLLHRVAADGLLDDRRRREVSELLRSIEMFARDGPLSDT